MNSSKPMTAYDATYDAYKLMYSQFRGNDLVEEARKIMDAPKKHGDTFLRKLRELRKDGMIDYEMIGSNKDSLYCKIERPKQMKLWK